MRGATANGISAKAGRIQVLGGSAAFTKILNGLAARLIHNKALRDAVAQRCPVKAVMKKFGDPDRIRTCDPQIRNLMLYPTELRGRKMSYIIELAVP